MKERKEVVELVMADLRKLKEEHVADLMKACRVEELEQLSNEIAPEETHFSFLKEFIQEEYLYLSEAELPDDCVMELAFYIFLSQTMAYQIVDNGSQFFRKLEDEGQLGNVIAKKFEKYNGFMPVAMEEFITYTSKEDVKKEVIKQLKKFQEEEHVADLMKAGRIEELKTIAQEIDFTMLVEYMNYDGKPFLDIKEIPQGSALELAFYISMSQYTELDVVEDFEKFMTELQTTGKLGKSISNNMIYMDLNEMSIEELTSYI